MPFSDNVEVLDLSKRLDSVESRKTPSPYNTVSSSGANSPNVSPDQLGALHLYNQSNILNGNSSAVYPSLSYQHPAYYQSSSNDTNDKISVLRRVQSLPVIPMSDAFRANHLEIIKTAAALQGQTMNGVSVSAVSPVFRTCESKVSAEETVRVAALQNVFKHAGKVARPFKVFPRDPIAMAATFTATDVLLDIQKAEKYRVFRKRMLGEMYEANGDKPTVRNPKMRRDQARTEEQSNDSCSSNDDSHNSHGGKNNSGGNHSVTNQNGVVKDAAYFERRKKNNAAAKKSRDRRRIKEDEIAVRAAFLEHENIELRIQIVAMKNQLALLGASVNR